MSHEIQRSLWVVAVGHALVLGLWILLSEINLFSEPEAPVVFELVAAQAPSAAQVTERDEDAPEVQPPLTVPPIETVEVPPLPEPSEPEAQRERISYEEWARNRQLPERVQRVQNRGPRHSAPVPEIETQIRDRLSERLSPIQIEGIGQLSAADSTALQRYLSALQARIQNAFQPSGSGLSAEASFRITAAGNIVDAALRASSGDAAFDQSVLRTLRSIQPPGPPPSGQSTTFSLTFRSE